MTSCVEIPEYQCHKKVRAAKITELRSNGTDCPSIVLGEIGGIVEQSSEWFKKHLPVLGGYYVIYEDGYASYSPAKAFESGYTKI